MVTCFGVGKLCGVLFAMAADAVAAPVVVDVLAVLVVVPRVGGLVSYVAALGMSRGA